MGGYWGVHASLKDTPSAFWAQDGGTIFTKAINFAQDLRTKQGSQMKWVNSTSSTDKGVFLDRGYENKARDGYNGWFLEKVPGDTEHNTYRLCTYQLQTGTSKVYLSALGDIASERTVVRTQKATLPRADCGTSTPCGVSFP